MFIEILADISYLYIDLKRFEDARRFIDEGFIFLNRHLNRFNPRFRFASEMVLYEVFAQYYKHLKNPQKAEQYYIQCLNSVKSLGSPHNLCIFQERIAAFYIDIGNFKAALSLTDTLLAASLVQADPEWETTIRVLRAKALIRLGATAAARAERAPLQNAVEDKGITDLAFRLDVLSGLAAIDSASGQLRSAYAFKREAEALGDSLFNETILENIAKIETRFELENEFAEQKRAQEREKIRQSAAQNARNERQFLGITVGLMALFSAGVLLQRRKIAKQKFVNFEKRAGLLIFGALLLAYEFMLIFLSPYISAFTNDVPLYKFACNIAVVAVLAPVFAYLKRTLEIRTENPADASS